MNEIVVDPVDPTNESTTPFSISKSPRSSQSLSLTQFQIIYNIGNSESTRDDGRREYCMFQR